MKLWRSASSQGHEGSNENGRRMTCLECGLNCTRQATGTTIPGSPEQSTRVGRCG